MSRVIAKVEGRVKGRFPRLLMLLDAPLGSSDACAVTITNMLGPWQADSVCQLYTRAVESPTCEGILSRLLSIPDRDLPRRVADSLYKRTRNYRLVTGEGTAADDRRLCPRGEPLLRRAEQLVKRFVTDALELSSFRANEIARSIEEFAPDAIYTIGESISMLRLSSQLSKVLSVPLIIHFMDDWPAELYKQSLIRAALRKRLAASLRAALSCSPLCIAISDEMRAEFEQRYGKPFSVLMNCLDDALLGDPLPMPPSEGQLRFVYIGKLRAGRSRLLADVHQAIQRHRPNKGAVLEIVCPEERELANAGVLHAVVDGSVTFRVIPEGDRLKELLTSAHCFVHVDGIDDAESRFFRHSISAKTPLYTGSGRPVLAYGDPALASMQIFDRASCGVLADRRDPRSLDRAIARLCENEALRCELGAKARTIAERWFSAAEAQAKFLCTVQEAIEIWDKGGSR